MQLAGIFESDPAPVVVAEAAQPRSLILLAGSAADPDAISRRISASSSVSTRVRGSPTGKRSSTRSVEFVEAAARRSPTILVFEDIHWADANLLDLVLTARDGACTGLPLLFC